MHFILACVVLYGLWHFRNQILEALYTRFRSSRKNGSNALTFTLSALLSELTDRERIIFRDNIDHIYRAIKKKSGYPSEVDVRHIETLLHRTAGHVSITPDVFEVFTKTFNLISESAKKAPANLENELSVEQIYIFLKDNI